MCPHYYLMKGKKILRLEANVLFVDLPSEVRLRVLDKDELNSLDQNQANWRVAIFRDEIMELTEFVEWMKSPEAEITEEELDLIAN